MPWGVPDRIPGAGAILYPSNASNTVISVAALLTTPYPDFITAPRMVTHVPGTSPYTLQDSQYTRFQQPSSYAQQSSSATWTLPQNIYGP
jgi:hypothetical protein